MGRFDSLLAIGVDDISYCRHHRYLTIVIVHDQERVIWTGEGKSADTLNEFFDELTDEQLPGIQFVSIDMANAYISAVAANLPDATIVFDRFHVACLAQDRVDEARRARMRALDPDDRRHLKRTRWVLLQRPGRLRPSERARLKTIRKANDKLYRAYLPKETLAGHLRPRQLDACPALLSMRGSPGRSDPAWSLSSDSLAPFASASTTSSPSSTPG